MGYRDSKREKAGTANSDGFVQRPKSCSWSCAANSITVAHPMRFIPQFLRALHLDDMLETIVPVTFYEIINNGRSIDPLPKL